MKDPREGPEAFPDPQYLAGVAPVDPDAIVPGLGVSFSDLEYIKEHFPDVYLTQIRKIRLQNDTAAAPARQANRLVVGAMGLAGLSIGAYFVTHESAALYLAGVIFVFMTLAVFGSSSALKEMVKQLPEIIRALRNGD